jgi:hypothetical protein
MHGSDAEAKRFRKLIIAAASWNWKGQPAFKSRRLPRVASLAVIGIWKGLLKALDDSRSRSAARVINQNRHLLQDFRDVAPSSAARVAVKTRQSRPGSDAPMRWGLYFLLAVLMAVLALSHVLALQKLGATQGERPATSDMLAD